MYPRTLSAAFLGLLALLPVPAVHAQNWSGYDYRGELCQIIQGYGPFDYTNPEHYLHKLPVVTKAHFTPNVENLIKGESGTIAADLTYTLRAFPNHHRALYSLVRYQLRDKNRRLMVSPECFLERATEFKADDAIVYMIYGIYLHGLDRLPDAEQKYQKAEELFEQPSAELFYNMGLLYVDMANYEAASRYARRAYDLGYQLPGLRQMLARRGHPLQ